MTPDQLQTFKVTGQSAM